MTIEIIKNTGVIVGAILSVITLLTIIIKPIRKKLMGWIRDTSHVENTDRLIIELKNSFDIFSGDIKNDIAELKADSELNREANRCICGNRIINAFHKYNDSDTIELFEQESLVEHYDIYKKLGGNGKIEKKYDELMAKKIKSG